MARYKFNIISSITEYFASSYLKREEHQKVVENVLRGNVPKSVPLDFSLENTFALYLYHQYYYPSL